MRPFSLHFSSFVRHHQPYAAAVEVDRTKNDESIKSLRDIIAFCTIPPRLPDGTAGLWRLVMIFVVKPDSSTVDETFQGQSKLCRRCYYVRRNYFTFTTMRVARKKNSGLQQDSNPWPLRSRCSALPTELTHTWRAGQFIELTNP